jgi:uncharacterized protein with FMN-binding domain
MGDFLWFISSKTLRLKFRVPTKVDAVLKYGKYVVLAFLVIFAWTLQLSFLDSSVSPWTVFGLYSSFGNWPSITTWFTAGGVLLIAIMIGSFFVERFFCRYLCPLGGIYAIFSKMRFFQIRKNRKNCGSCKLCSAKCSMGIPLSEVDKVTSGECINCFNCVAWCPKKNAAVKPDPAVASAVSIVAITGLVYAGNTASAAMENALSSSSGSSSSVEQTQPGKYTDGTYTGTGTGFRGETEVSVEVSNGYITDITIVSYKDDTEYFNRAKNTVISDIINEQSTDVSAVSGATFSSNGIMNAVANALSSSATTSSNNVTTNNSATDNAVTNNSTAASASQSTETNLDTTTDANSATIDANSTSESSSSTATDTGSYTDGTYTGTGTGFRGDTEVSVTVEGGKISDITINSYQDDRQYFNRAQSTIISEIIEAQDVNVTAVSGATFSSNGIMEAVANALNVSYTNSNSSNTRGHGGPRG